MFYSTLKNKSNTGRRCSPVVGAIRHRLSFDSRSLQSATNNLPGAAMKDLPGGNQRLLWRGLIALFVGLALWPLWSVRFPQIGRAHV